MKVSIIIPTYNDAGTIEKTLDSVLEQSYEDYEVIIVDDGSTDNTKEIIEKYRKNKDNNDKIKYIYQENKDQLNAILYALNFISGEYIFTLHSDDLINEPDSIEKCVKYMEENRQLDSIIGDLIVIDKEDNVTGRQVVRKYENKEYMIPLQLLWLGRNLYVDVGFHRKDAYLKRVKENYLKWNTPFWIDFNDEISMLNVEKVEFSFYKYRVFEENYINNYMGQLNVINGELRTAIKIMKNYSIPLYKLQYFMFRLLNKFHIKYVPVYFKKEQKNKDDIIKFILEKRFGDKYTENLYLDALLKFYSINSDRVIKIDSVTDDVYMGKDVRIFNKKLVNNELDETYVEILKEMSNGFGKIIVSKGNREKIENICKFLCIYPKIEVV